MRIALGSDHRGLRLKGVLKELLQQLGHSYQDFGCFDETACDYPDVAAKVARAVARGEFERGILVCSTGIGMCIAANKVHGIRAALCHDLFTTRRARQHNDANILCLGEEEVAEELAREMVKVFLTTEFEGGRHQRRLDKVHRLEDGLPLWGEGDNR